jgi:polyphosphate kinase 2 (PPK2 family)
MMRHPGEQEQRYPWLRRYWLRLPVRGDLVLFDGGWYGQVLAQCIEDHMRDDEARAAYRDCLDLERMLVDDGHVVVKIWFHISQEEQRRRLRAPIGEALHWPGSRAEDWRQYRKHRQYLPLVEEMLAQTSVDGLRWTLIAATNRYYAQWRVMQTVADALESGLTRAGVEVASDEDALSADPQLSPLTEDEL